MSAADPAAGADAYRAATSCCLSRSSTRLPGPTPVDSTPRTGQRKATVMDHGDHHGAITVYRDRALADDTDDVKASVLVNLSQSLTDVGDLDGAFEATRARGLVGDGVVGDVLVACYASLTTWSAPPPPALGDGFGSPGALDVDGHAPDRLGNALQNIAVANSIGR